MNSAPKIDNIIEKSTSFLNNTYAIGGWKTGAEVGSLTLTDSLNTLFIFLNNATSGTVFWDSPDNYLTNILVFPFDYYNITNGSGKDLYIRNVQIKQTISGINYNVRGKNISKNSLFDLGSIRYPYCDSGKFYHRSGYTKLRLYLPFMGFIDLNPNDFIGEFKYITILLSVDVKTGQATYIVCSSKATITSTTPLITTDLDPMKFRIVSTHTFKLALEIPIGSTNATNNARNAIMGVMNVAASFASYGISNLAGAGISTSHSTTTSNKATVQKVRAMSKTSEGYMPVGAPLVRSTTGETTTTTTDTTYNSTGYLKGKLVNECFDGLGSAFSSVFASGDCDRPNNINSLLNCPRHCFIQIFTPKMKSDTNYNELYGKPLGEVRRIGDMEGYTEIAKVHIQGDSFKKATLEEIGMLSEALSNGIILPISE